jgi:dihydrofolate reductase
MNDSPKYVISSSLQRAEWSNSTILGGYSAEAVRSLKDQTDGQIYVSGSGTLVNAMLGEGLVDDLHLFVYPLTLGAGQRLFANGPKTTLTLAESDAYDNGVLHLHYQPTA